MKVSFLLPFSLLVGSVLVSCEKNKVTPLETNGCLLTRDYYSRNSYYANDTMVYKYDSRNRIIAIDYTKTAGETLKPYVTFEYNSKNQLIRSRSLWWGSSDSLLQQIDYDARGRWIKTITLKNGAPFKTYTVTYDASGYRTRIDMKAVNGATYSVTYSYQNGNLSEGGNEYYLDKEDKQKPLYDQLAPFFVSGTASKNLLKKYVMGGQEPTYLRYEFNDRGYPTKVIRTISSYSDTTTYEYQCK